MEVGGVGERTTVQAGRGWEGEDTVNDPRQEAAVAGLVGLQEGALPGCVPIERIK